MKPKKNQKNADTLIAENRKARFEYAILETFEAGLMLTGTEVKSVRSGKVQLANAYADIRQGEAFLLQCHISPYEKGGYANHEPLRKRKLLLHRKEIDTLIGKIQAKGLTLIPLKMYFKGPFAKVLLGLGKGKKTHDKRESLKEKDSQRQIDKSLKMRNR